jgi:hypothetical protein
METDVIQNRKKWKRRGAHQFAFEGRGPTLIGVSLELRTILGGVVDVLRDPEGGADRCPPGTAGLHSWLASVACRLPRLERRLKPTANREGGGRR